MGAHTGFLTENPSSASSITSNSGDAVLTTGLLVGTGLVSEARGGGEDWNRTLKVPSKNGSSRNGFLTTGNGGSVRALVGESRTNGEASGIDLVDAPLPPHREVRGGGEDRNRTWKGKDAIRKWHSGGNGFSTMEAVVRPPMGFCRQN
ncbi:hypothetical protein ACLOJK_017889 [Asimina triloba]